MIRFRSAAMRLCVLVCGLEVRAADHKLAAERAHRRVLAGGVAFRHHQGRGEAEPGRGEGDALAVIAPRGADHARDPCRAGAGRP